MEQESNIVRILKCAGCENHFEVPAKRTVPYRAYCPKCAKQINKSIFRKEMQRSQR